MEGQEQETIEQPAQIYDMDKGEFVDNPALKQEETTEETEEQEEAGEGETSSEEQETTEETEESEETEETEETEENKEEVDDVLDEDTYISTVYGEKFGIKTKDELETLVTNAVELQDEHEALKKENETLKAEVGKPKFSSDKQQKAFEFLQKFDIDRQGEALDTFAKLVSMDVETSDPLMVLEEKFIHEHPEWTRAEAQRMFAKDYKKRYDLKKEQFDSEEEYTRELADLEIEKRGEVTRARNYLKDQQAKYKPQTAEAKPAVSEVVTKSIEKTAPEYTTFADKANEITFEHDGEKFAFKLDADKKSKVSAAVSEWVKNPANYNKDGKLLGVKDPDHMLNMVIGGMFMNDVIKAISDQVKNSVQIKRVDELGTKKPQKRSAPGSGEANKGGNDLYAQAAKLMNKKKAA